MYFIIHSFIALLLVALMGCSKSPTSPEDKNVPGPTRNKVFVVDQSGKKLSVFDTQSGALSPDVADVGDACNDALIFNGELYVVNSLSNNVEVINTSNYSKQIIDLPNANPYLICANNSTVFVSGLLSGKVYLIKDHKVQDSLQAGKKPQGLYADQSYLYVTIGNYDYGDSYFVNYGQGMLLRISLANHTLRDSIPVGVNPMAIQISQGKLHVGCVSNDSTKNSFIYKIDTTSFNVLDSLDLGMSGAGSIIRINSENKGYVQPKFGGTALLVYDAASMKLGTAISVDPAVNGVGGIALDADDDLYVCSAAWGGTQNALFRIAKGTTNAVKLHNLAGWPTSLVVMEVK